MGFFILKLPKKVYFGKTHVEKRIFSQEAIVQYRSKPSKKKNGIF